MQSSLLNPTLSVSPKNGLRAIWFDGQDHLLAAVVDSKWILCIRDDNPSCCCIFAGDLLIGSIPSGTVIRIE